ncbi:acetyl esterase/lipase [Dyadobacter jejuensis]|uniref:Acetyl esterase/lipase n=1 Tax=Dyadobacter jejuensis TaxID=1082580 RepID=A0A316BAG7_9BACT|nr:alpha/beta hydrolase [Dyadobacter jejuensis]PWJ59537.1 acetyl esterase/lipase [Dyadobacter jejuensis]
MYSKTSRILWPLSVCLVLLLSSCSIVTTRRNKNIVYQAATTKSPELKLDVYTDPFFKGPKPVWLFIHGGNWNSGRKEQYRLMGRNIAAKGMVAVIIDYTLSPAANYKQMAQEAARSVAWTQEHIAQYEGNPQQIYVSGHSAGGHLASLISIDDRYFDSLGMANPIKGTLLIDAAGLDMHGYLKNDPPKPGRTYANTFGLQERGWKDASPLYHLHRDMPPMILLMGGKTYPSIIAGTESFREGLEAFAPETPFVLQKSKKHIPMILQFFNPLNRQYRKLHHFISDTNQRRSAVKSE